jgi:predicted N-acetyltransferase YhbS
VGQLSVSIRPAELTDGPSLLELSRNCPMHGAISLTIEREPDFFALSRARGSARTLVAEAGGRLVGCVGLARRPAWVDGRRAEIAYLADLKVAPAQRRSGLGSRLVATMLASEARARPLPLVATVAAGNRAVERLAVGLRADCGLRGAIEVTCLQLFAAPAPVEPGIELGRAQPGDEASLAGLLDRFYRERQFAPIFDDGGFKAMLACSPGLALEDHLVARRGSRIVAAVAMSALDSLKRVRLLRVTPALRLGLAALAAAARALSMPAPPAPGGELRLVFLRHPAHAPGEEAALAALIRRATREARTSGHHFAVLTVPAHDPLARCARSIPRVSYRYRLLVGATAPLSSSPSLASRVAFDDAALS